MRTHQILGFVVILASCGSEDDVTYGACTPDRTDCTAWLAAHNAVRCNVTPAAASMPRVAWDAALECVAKKFANTCPGGHNAARTEMYAECGGSGYVGENLAMGYADETAAVQGWAGEAIDYDLATNTCMSGKACGHYTQIVWANTLRIGCARPDVSCPQWGKAVYVCNYAPGGNYVGQPPYTAGSGTNASCE